MPNWCENTLTVRGARFRVLDFVRRARQKRQPGRERSSPRRTGPVHTVSLNLLSGTVSFSEEAPVDDAEPQVLPLSFQSLVPLPRNGDILDAVKLWGSKWDAQAVRATDVLRRGRHFCVEYAFETPWGPPMEFLERVAKKFPMLVFRLIYAEPDMGFAGDARWARGKRTSHRCRAIDDE